MNHSSTRRKTSGVLQRQQCGIAVLVRLEAVEASLALEVLDDRLGDVADVPSGQRSEPVDHDPALVERGDDREAELAPELEVLGAAAGRHVDDAGPLVLADLAPGDDPVAVGAPAASEPRRPGRRRP